MIDDSDEALMHYALEHGTDAALRRTGQPATSPPRSSSGSSNPATTDEDRTPWVAPDRVARRTTTTGSVAAECTRCARRWTGTDAPQQAHAHCQQTGHPTRSAAERVVVSYLPVFLPAEDEA